MCGPLSVDTTWMLNEHFASVALSTPLTKVSNVGMISSGNPEEKHTTHTSGL